MAYFVLRIGYCVLGIAYGVWRISYGVLRMAYGVWRISYGVNSRQKYARRHTQSTT